MASLLCEPGHQLCVESIDGSTSAIEGQHYRQGQTYQTRDAGVVRLLELEKAFVVTLEFGAHGRMLSAALEAAHRFKLQINSQEKTNRRTAL